MIYTRFAIFAALLFLPTRAQSQETTFRAGFARMSITPELPDTWTDANANSVYEPDDGDTSYPLQLVCPLRPLDGIR